MARYIATVCEYGGMGLRMIVSDLFGLEMWVTHLLCDMMKANVWGEKNISEKIKLRPKNITIDTTLTYAPETGITNKERQKANKGF